MSTTNPITIEDCTRALTGLAGIYRTRIDVPQFRLYHRALSDVPAPLLLAAIERAPAVYEFFPKPVELRRLAETERRAALAAHPFEPCAMCERSPGWNDVETDGVVRLTRCACFQQWRARLETLGITGKAIAAITSGPVVAEVEA